ncbi:HAD-IA family hydrolase [Streptomyces alkaliterrae]|uniref:HAD-IA family hydrolase n=1 Tax=Streptomyces alkaliterrae TaxID=2213162 RepID=UPI001E46EB1A|nr:HAD-IA family hydrolase [Streptomyces alkaliterrae]
MAEGTTAGVAYAPERDLPLLLGRISYEEWTDAVERGRGEWLSDGRRARDLAVAFAEAPSRVDQVAAERAGVPEERCLFVDDRLENVEAAVACGMRGVHYRQVEDLRGALEGMWEGR